jgi:hypothetical protein
MALHPQEISSLTVSELQQLKFDFALLGFYQVSE